MEGWVKSERSEKWRDHYNLKNAFGEKADKVTFRQRGEYNNLERYGVYDNEGRFTVCA
ncbi:MAG: hypothetical protein V4456_14555 [Bacteroidota bacterium]